MTEEQAKAVGRIPSGLFIVAVEDEGKIDGFLGSFIQQVSFDPLLVMMAIKPGRPAYDAILKGCVFTINIVGEHDRSYLKHFWKGYDPDENPFSHLPFQKSPHGGIHLLQALGSIDLKKKQHVEPGDHTVVFAEVLDSVVRQEDAKPLIHVRKHGLKY